jgi:peptidoglycan/xylan/chitin deacetylase (PgdA/CDA1 family)
VKVVADSGVETATVSDWLSGASGSERNLLITFDDGFADNLDAVDLLVSSGMRATVYITTGYVDRPNMVTARQVAELAAVPGVEVGAHSVTHVRLDELPASRVDGEIRESVDRVEQQAQARVRSFAYPHGSFDRRVRRMAARHVESAVAVRNRLSYVGEDPYALSRLTVESGTAVSEVANWVQGEGALTAHRREAPRTTVYRAYRRLRRAVARPVVG